MAQKIYIDFSEIGDLEDFYKILKQKITLPEHFGNNLDALYDSLTGDVALPLSLEFFNLSVDQLETFEDLLETLEDAEEETDGFSFCYFLEQFEDDDEDLE